MRIPVDPSKENPRWTRCRVALGREPKTYEYVAWSNRCWAEFCKQQGVRDMTAAELKLGREAAHAAFDAFQDGWAVPSAR